jgi:hypothetical protein
VIEKAFKEAGYTTRMVGREFPYNLLDKMTKWLVAA